jgi:hypothetical protein
MDKIIGMLAKMQERMIDREDVKETMACIEKTEVRLGKEKPTSEDMTPEVAHEQEVPLEDSVVMPVTEPRNTRRDRHLAAQRRQKKQQKRTQSKDGCRRNSVTARRGTTRRAQVARRRSLFTKKTRDYRAARKDLAVARRGTTRRAKVAWQKLNQGLYESQNKKKPSAERRSGPTAGANAAQPLSVNGSASWSVFRRQFETIAEHKQRSHLEKSTYLVTALKSRTADVLCGILRDRKIKKWTLCRGRPPTKRKKGPHTN